MRREPSAGRSRFRGICPAWAFQALCVYLRRGGLRASSGFIALAACNLFCHLVASMPNDSLRGSVSRHRRLKGAAFSSAHRVRPPLGGAGAGHATERRPGLPRTARARPNREPTPPSTERGATSIARLGLPWSGSIASHHIGLLSSCFASGLAPGDVGVHSQGWACFITGNRCETSGGRGLGSEALCISGASGPSRETC